MTLHENEAKKAMITLFSAQYENKNKDSVFIQEENANSMLCF